MSLPTSADLRARAEKLWESQAFLRAWLAGETLFPWELPLKVPAGADLARRFAEVRPWLQALRAGSKDASGAGYRLIERDIDHRQLGAQQLPVRAVIDTEDDFLALTRKRQAFVRFKGLAEETRRRVPALEDYLRRKPLAVLERSEVWSRLLTVCEFFRAMPRPGRYLRELDIEGVDTKFIEQNKGVLRELLAIALPEGACDASIQGLAAHGFERALGLRYDPPLIRFRLLDPAMAVGGFTDLSVPLADFAAFAPAVERVFITENKINGLSFPAHPCSMVIFGLGYGVGALAEVAWLKDKAVTYWGDIDTHGFAILDQLRSKFPTARSLLMDRATLLQHKDFWGAEDRPTNRELERLQPAEAALYDDLRCNRIAAALRLEQERIGFAWVEAALAGLGG